MTRSGKAALRGSLKALSDLMRPAGPSHVYVGGSAEPAKTFTYPADAFRFGASQGQQGETDVRVRAGGRLYRWTGGVSGVEFDLIEEE